MNLAINKTLSRTLMTSLTTFIPAVFLYVFCSGVVSDYALVFLLGILVGTFSSIFIASPIFYFWNRGNRNNIAKPSEDEEATRRAKAEGWLPYSRKIAIRAAMAMKRQNITRSEVATRMGCSPQYVSRLLKGEENLSLETICKLEHALNVPILQYEFA